MSKTQYAVVITATVTYNYVIDANSPEEAELIAQSYFEDGEKGSEVCEAIEDIEVNEQEQDEDAFMRLAPSHTTYGSMVTEGVRELI